VNQLAEPHISRQLQAEGQRGVAQQELQLVKAAQPPSSIAHGKQPANIDQIGSRVVGGDGRGCQ
jgi:hypothetical protein